MPEKPVDSLEVFTLEPMSAGDIIDRAVRLYKRNFLSLVKIVLAPSLIAYLGSILFSIGMHNFSLMRGDTRVALTTGMLVTGGTLWLFGNAAFYAVIGGSSRSLIGHFFEGKPILVREVYRAVRQRFWALIGATMLILVMVVAVSYVMIIMFTFLAIIIGALAGAVISKAPSWIVTIYFVLSSLGIIGLVIFSFLLVYSRVVYVPQVMMVEGKGVFASITRSFQLARGEMIPIGAVIFFWIYAAWSIWFLMAIPVGAYAYLDGVDVGWFNPEAPIWYQIANQTLTKVSEILIWPIAMLCFTLLYINSRVRKEGYDIELLSNRVLAAPLLPTQAQAAQAPIQVAVASPASILGLSDYRPAPINGAPPQMPPMPREIPPAAVEVGAPAEQAMPAMDLPVMDRMDDVPAFIDSVDAPPVEMTITPPQQAAAPGLAPEEAGAPAATFKTGGESSASPDAATGNSCKWCGTPAGVQDRFCAVCGSVF